jgi:hypothetical protein
MEANGKTFPDTPSTNGKNRLPEASEELQITAVETAKKPRGRPFSKGHKGCGGRPKGARKGQKQGKSTGRKQGGDGILEAMRKAAIKGSVSAARFVKDYELPEGDTGPTLSEILLLMLTDPERVEFEQRMDEKYLREPGGVDLSGIPVLNPEWHQAVKEAEQRAKEAAASSSSPAIPAS